MGEAPYRVETRTGKNTCLSTVQGGKSAAGYGREVSRKDLTNETR
jgi:hypothetical protein